MPVKISTPAEVARRPGGANAPYPLIYWRKFFKSVAQAFQPV
jgi:hypothetical protein